MIELGDIVCCKITGKNYLVISDKISWVYVVRYGRISAIGKDLIFISIKNKNVAKWMREAIENKKPSFWLKAKIFLNCKN